MPWHVESDHPDCSGYAVVKDDSGEMVGCHMSEAEAEDHMKALYANEDEGHKPMTKHTRELFLAPIEGVEWRESGAGKGNMTVSGHAAVFNRLSLDLGGFREKLAPGAFTAVLDSDPDVHLLWDHSTSLTLARTRNKTLDLREDPKGLHFWGRVADTSYSRDLRILMERQDIDQASFAFGLPEDGSGEKWESTKDSGIVRTVLPNGVSGLYDVTITAQGAYPQTDSALRSLRRAVEGSRIEGLTLDEAYDLAADLDVELRPSNTTQFVMSGGIVPKTTYSVGTADPELFVPAVSGIVATITTSTRSGSEEAVVAAPAEPVDDDEGTPPPLETQDGDEERSAAPETVDASEAATDLLAQLKAEVRATRNEAHESSLQLLKDEGLA